MELTPLNEIEFAMQLSVYQVREIVEHLVLSLSTDELEYVNEVLEALGVVEALRLIYELKGDGL